MKIVEVGKNDENQSIEKFMKKFFKTMPSSLIYKFLRKDCVKVNGKHVKSGFELNYQDKITFYIQDEFFDRSEYELDFLKAKVDFHSIYEDENIILINKQPGIRMHDDKEHKIDTLLSQVKKYLYKKNEYHPNEENVFSPAFCNRIDTNTAGIVIAAKNAEALRTMNEHIKNDEVKKFYLCVCEGKFAKKSDTLIGFLIKDEVNNKVRIFTEPKADAKKVVTYYRVLEEKGNLSLVEVQLLTGRSHQIRAHLASIGNPVAGDLKYGHMSHEFHHQALCSYKIKFDFHEPGMFDYLNQKTFQIPIVRFSNKFVVSNKG